MKKSTLLVLMGKDGRPADIQRLVDQAVADKHFLSVLVIGGTPDFPYYADPIGPYGASVMANTWQEDFEKASAEIGKAAKVIKEYLLAQQVECEVSVICAEQGSIAEAIARWAMVSDFVVVSNDLRKDEHLFNVAVQAALFRAPNGVLLNGTASAAALAPSRVLVAWRPAKSCARAVQAAMPMLLGAKEVTLMIVDPVTSPMRDGENPGVDVARQLSHRGCKVIVQQAPSGSQDIGQVLMRHARELGADLLVMGAYDHSRLREIVFGGTTSTLVGQSDLAVLMAH